MNKTKFDPDWMKDPEIMKEIFRDSMKERDEIIKRYQNTLEEVLKISKGSENDRLQMVHSMVKKTLEKK